MQHAVQNIVPERPYRPVDMQWLTATGAIAAGDKGAAVKALAAFAPGCRQLLIFQCFGYQAAFHGSSHCFQFLRHRKQFGLFD